MSATKTFDSAFDLEEKKLLLNAYRSPPAPIPLKAIRTRGSHNIRPRIWTTKCVGQMWIQPEF